MGLSEWVKKKMMLLAIATSAVEKGALGQGGGKDLGTVDTVRRHRQGSLLDSLAQGEINQEVKDLRWRMYKVMDEAQGYKTKVIGYDEDGYPITDTVKIDVSENGRFSISNVKVDEHDKYSVELVVNNDEITMDRDGVTDEVTEFDLEKVKESIVYNEDTGEAESATLGVISADAHESANKSERVIKCIKDGRLKFELENFTKKMNVRTITPTEKLLEFYVSIYPDEFNRRSNLFLSEIKKAMKNPRIADFLDITGVEFISYNTVGCKDLHHFEYKIKNFDKLVEYDGYYIIKFKADVITDGVSLYEQFREEGLEERYKNNEPRERKE